MSERDKLIEKERKGVLELLLKKNAKANLGSKR